MALCGLMSSSNFLSPATDTAMCGSSLYGLTPRHGALLALSMVKTDENCISRMLALAWLSLWTVPFFMSGATPLFSFFLLLIKDQNFFRFTSF